MWPFRKSKKKESPDPYETVGKVRLLVIEAQELKYKMNNLTDTRDLNELKTNVERSKKIINRMQDIHIELLRLNA